MSDTTVITRTVTADRPGPVYLHITAEAAVLTVTADPDITTATIELTPNRTDDPAAVAAVLGAAITFGIGWYVQLVIPAALEQDRHPETVTATTAPGLVVITARVPAGSQAEALITRGHITMTGPLVAAYAEPGPAIDLTAVTTTHP